MKKYLEDCIAILVFLVISFVYFMPSVLDGRVLLEHDAAAGIGAGEEAREYYEQNNERTRWTNGLFSGMPTYQISPSYDSTDNLKFIEKVYRLFLPQYVGYLFIMMLGFYILLRSLKLPPIVSCLGGVVWTFSSYFFILIAAGHLWKFITLAYIPPTIAGIILVYNRKYILGAIIAALFASLQILSNHIQMTYYSLFVILCIFIAYYIDAKQKNELKSFFKGTGILIVSACIALAINASNLYHTYQYSKESTRGKSELVTNNNSESQGVDKAYITQWSYGVDETLTLLIPNFKGGPSKPLAQNSTAMEKMDPTFNSIYEQVTEYFGNQPFTAGPVYVGAFVLFLFIVGCMVVKGPLKWALIAATILSISLAWGKNFMPLTNLFIDYIPFYNKFRAVSSILVIAEFTIPLLAILGLAKLLTSRDNLQKHKKPLLISLGVTISIALITALAPSLLAGPFVTDQEYLALGQIEASISHQIFTNLESGRQAIVKADAWRTIIVIILGCLPLFFYFKGKINKISTVILIFGLCLIDMWMINSRYLNDSLFVPKSDISKVLKATNTDKTILQDKDPNYRVLNLSTNTFNENVTSYRHKSIGGYNAVKLRRYQELIEAYIQPEMKGLIDYINTNQTLDINDTKITPILNMLNTKYFILNGNNGFIINKFNNGNAWFVSQINKVQSANEEIHKLGTIDTKTTAIINTEHFNIDEKHVDSSGTIFQTSYSPNELTYKVNTRVGGIALFSEIYYPGWTAEIDDKELPIFRSNYVLRGIDLPAGEYDLKLSFHPSSLKVTEGIAYTALILLVIGIIALLLKQRKQLV